jgi:serine/threonine protein kinase/tetratricopeptide (TPR) repeat protein
MPEGSASGRDAASDEDRVAQIVEEWRRRDETGRRVDPEGLIREHADLAGPLRRAFNAMRMLDRTFPRAAPRAARSLDGRRVGAYRVESMLGSGGMGTVHLARVEGAVPGLGAGARVALKVVHPHLLEREGYVERFLREAELGRRVRHENVVRTLDAGVDAGEDGRRQFLVMEYVEGRTLRALLEESGSQPEELCRHIGRAIALALDAIHAVGVVHRDLKPDNVIVTADHVVKVMDLGVARFVENAARLSRTGAFVGSLRYAAPEQFGAPGAEGAWGDTARSGAGARGGIDHRTDLHALGLLLYELATGTHPFDADDFGAVVRKVLDEVPRRAGTVNPQISPLYEELCAQLLEKDPALRVQSAAEVAAILAEGETSAWWRARAQAIRRATRRPLRRIRLPRDTPLHGRSPELARLRALYERASVGDGQVVIVEGEAGIGKSRLVDEFVLSLWSGGADLEFLHGSYPPGGAATASGAFSTAYGAHLGDDDSAIREALPQTPLLVPSFAALLRGDAAPEGSERLTKDSLQTVFVHATRSFAARRTTIVLIDDLHFAPEEGRGIFASLALAVPGHRILLIGCTRPSADDRWAATLSGLPYVTRLALARLGAKDLVSLLADALRSKHLAEELAGKVADKSDGNPLFVFEILRGLREARLLARRPDGAWATTKEIREIEVPPSIVGVIQARVADLSGEDRAVLEVAACVGFEFDAALVGEVLDVAPIPLLQRLGTIEMRHRLVRAAGHLFTFDHHQVEEVLYAGLSAPLREAYHAAIAEALESRHDAASKDPAAVEGALCVDLAEHFLKGGRGDRAVRYLDEALADLGRRYRGDAAVRLLSRALAVPGLLAGRDRCRFLLRKAEGLSALGRRDEEKAALDEALALADAAGDARLRGRTLCAIGRHLVRVSSFDRAAAVLDDAMTLAHRTGEAADEAEALAHLGTVSLRFGSYDEARARFEACLELRRRVGDLRGEAASVGHLGLVEDCLGRYGEARTHYARQLEVSQSIGDRETEATALDNLGSLATVLGRRADAGELLARGLSLARQIGARQCEYALLHDTAMLAAEQADDVSAERSFSQALSLSRAIGHRSGEATTLCFLGSFLARRHRADDARPGFEAALATAQEISMPSLELLATAWLAALAPADAGDAVRRARATFRACEARTEVFWRLEAHYVLWQAAHDRADLAAAARLLDGLVDHAPPECRESMVANYWLHREIADAAGEHGIR